MNRRTFLQQFAAAMLASRMVSLGDQAPDAAAESIGPMNNAFAADLYAQLDSGKGNLFFSPTSVETALAMTWAGARGATAQEMAQTLHLENDPKTMDQLGDFLRNLNEQGKKGGYELAVADALWSAKAYPFQPAYLQLVESKFGGHLSELDFAADPESAREVINKWVSDQTHDKIQDLMPKGSIFPNTRLVLTNAIYFKGKWDHIFESSRTKEADFTTSPGKTAKVSMMSQQSHFGYAENDDTQVLEMTYGHGDLAMRIYLPKKPDGLSDFEKGLTPQRLEKLDQVMQMEEVLISIPKFKIESGFNLTETLSAMGMKRAFGPQADFSGMATAEQLCIGLVIHKAYVNVDEEGTEAAGATGVTMRPTAIHIPVQPKVFRADHPFLFTIVDRKSRAILFMGRFIGS